MFHDEPELRRQLLVSLARIDDRCQVHPCHGHDSEDMLEVPEVDGKRRCDHGDSQGQNVLDDHDDRKAAKSQDADRSPRYDNNDEDYDKAKEHVHKTARYIGYRQYFSREVDLLNEVLLRQDRCGAAGDRGLEKDPRNERHTKEQVIFFHACRKNVCEYERVDEDLEQRVNEGPEKAQYRTLVTSAKVLLDEAYDHLFVIPDLF